MTKKKLEVKLAAKQIEVESDLYAAIQDPVEREIIRRFEKYRISSKTEIVPEKPCLSIDGVGFFTKGNIHAIKGEAKAGKTTVSKVIISALMKGEMFHLQSEIKEAKVVFFDSEQSDEDAQRIITDVKLMTGLKGKYIDKHLHLFALRKLDCTQLLGEIETNIKYLLPDVVFIDGIVDFVNSFNDEKESKNLIRKLMRMSSEYKCAIVNILHTNPGDVNGKMRGHLGTMLAQKASTVLDCNNKVGIITVTSAETRHTAIPSWSISFGDGGVLEDGTAKHQELVSKKQADKEQKKKQNQEKILEERIEIAIALLREKGPLKRSLFMAVLKGALNKKDTIVKELIRAMFDRNIITQSDDNLIQLNAQETETMV